ncbi:MAG: hypothetical protein HQK96_09280 [Nitrospirae bacterium]|nr:hypothetical protein [Nitrospirota bacterium]
MNEKLNRLDLIQDPDMRKTIEATATPEYKRVLIDIALREQDHEATGVLQLPLWPEAKRGVPNSFLRSSLFSAIQSKDRQFLKAATLASQNGIIVKFTGEQLNQEDLTLWETLVHMARKHPLGDICTFTAHGILKEMGQATGGEQHEQLHKNITRLIACAVEIREA